MKSYRDYLNERKVPLGPWCTDENDSALNKKVVQLKRGLTKAS